MKHTSHPQSATSLPRAPRDDISKRSVHYLVMMGIRVVCVILAIVVTPYSWWTAVFAVGAIFIPYVAVVLANVSEAAKSVPAVPVEREIEERMTPWPATPRPRVIRVDERHPVEAQRPDPAAEGPSAPGDTSAPGDAGHHEPGEKPQDETP